MMTFTIEFTSGLPLIELDEKKYPLSKVTRHTIKSQRTINRLRYRKRLSKQADNEGLPF